MRDELAHLLFITDNRNARDVEAEWRAGGDKELRYVYAMADALIAAGYAPGSSYCGACGL